MGRSQSLTDVMTKLTLAMGKRRRLWPPDASSCIASIGLLGWMHLTYTPPESAVSEMVGLLWLSGLRGLDEREQRVERRLLAGDQLAIDSYAAAVASRLLSDDGPIPSVDTAVVGDAHWDRREYDELCLQGARHGSALRQTLVELCAQFEGHWHEAERMGPEFSKVPVFLKKPSPPQEPDESIPPLEVRRSELFEWVMKHPADGSVRGAGNV